MADLTERGGVLAVIALGANLAQPKAQLQAALLVLSRLPEITVQQVSSFYRTKPVGYTAQPDFINAVALLRTTYPPLDLLRVLHDTENRFGRERSFRNAPRTLDLDIIDYDHRKMNTAQLQLPHPRAHERGFVMTPLAEIAPHYVLGGQHCEAAALAAQLAQQKPAETVLILPESD